MPQNLVIDLSFNCPQVHIVGPVKESTIERLNEVLPNSTTSTRSIRAGAPKFEYLSNPDHWSLKLDGQFCDAEGISRFMVILLDALEEEGGWKLASSQASTERNEGALQQAFVEHYKLFFTKFSGEE